jgi:hypothetical protein
MAYLLRYEETDVNPALENDMTSPDHLAIWRRQYEEIHESMIKSREQFMAWSEEIAMIIGENQTVEFRRCVAQIKKDLQRYREVMKQLPTKVEEFSDEEVETMSGKASQLLDVAGEVTTLHTHVRHLLRSCTSS